MIALSCGPAYVLSSTESSYALPPVPAKNVTVIIASGAIISISNDNSNWQAATLDTNKNFLTSAKFIRTTTADATIAIGRY